MEPEPMLQPDINPLPRTPAQWIGAIILLAGWIASITAVWTKLVDKIDGLVGRVDKLELANSEKDGRMARYENEFSEMRRALADGATRLGRLESGVEGLDDHITGMELKIEGRLSEIKEMISTRDGSLRERIARLEAENDS